eukprot:TRINITY_DN7304_c0_g1_i3.p1 TRINITY_DN7304_c0_g1~~TRINITY_DN7304_c0_g1_i3.p1  ORF type:complete len:373 (-),score=57.74 TRINITY_DN7304_c0_g1_i3:43-1161(-)
MSTNKVPSAVASAVLVKSEAIPENTPVVKGWDFNNGRDYDGILQSYITTGFQALNFGRAVEEINAMLAWDLSEVPFNAETENDDLENIENRKKVKTKIFLGYTSNLVSSGLRETIRWLAEHKMIDAIVTTAGGIEEDIIKCKHPTYLGSFELPGGELRSKGINRIGNLLVPNSNYCFFEDWTMPIFDKMLAKQKSKGKIYTPSSMIRLFGKHINDPSSIYYWCYKNNIPVFSPAITDGSIGDMLYMHSYSNPGLIIDIAGDIRNINDLAAGHPGRTGMIILGGGLVKHHICNANLMRNGAEYSVYVNTAQEFDGSDAGARPDEAKSWGKIKPDSKAVKLYAEATLVFPLLVAQTFVKYHEQFGNRHEDISSK